MAEWRVARGWSDRELATRLSSIESLPRNFDPNALRPEKGFHYHHSTAVIAREPAGRPVLGGPFDRAVTLITDYEFSDPRIVKAHFDRARPLRGRRMLLELAPIGLRYLTGVVVAVVHRDEDSFGFRYDTLEGHIESGAEWFFLEKDRATGDVRFHIEAAWKPGDMPNAWSRIGFALVGRHYQRAWHRLAHLRLRELLASPGDELPPLAPSHRIVHEGRRLRLPRNPGPVAWEEQDLR